MYKKTLNQVSSSYVICLTREALESSLSEVLPCTSFHLRCVISLCFINASLHRRSSCHTCSKRVRDCSNPSLLAPRRTRSSHVSPNPRHLPMLRGTHFVIRHENIPDSQPQLLVPEASGITRLFKCLWPVSSSKLVIHVIQCALDNGVYNVVTPYKTIQYSLPPTAANSQPTILNQLTSTFLRHILIILLFPSSRGCRVAIGYFESIPIPRISYGYQLTFFTSHLCRIACTADPSSGRFVTRC